MRLKIFFSVTLLAATSAWAGIVDSVRMSLSQSNFSAAESQLASYRSQRGIDAEYVEAYSWMARAALDAGQYDQASAYAKETKTLVLEQLKQRGLDAEPHLPMALGAAFEVQSQALGRPRAENASGSTASVRAAHVRKYFHPRSHSEKPELDLVSGKDCTSPESRSIARIELACCGSS